MWMGTRAGARKDTLAAPARAFVQSDVAVQSESRVSAEEFDRAVGEVKETPRQKARSRRPNQRVTKRTKERLSYALPESMISEDLERDLKAFIKFCTVPFYDQQEKRMALVTAQQYRTVLLRMLGWMEFVRDNDVGSAVEAGSVRPEVSEKVEKTKLRLKDLIPSAERAGVRLTFDHLQWLSTERETSPLTELFYLRAMTCCAKYLYHDQSNAQPSEGDKPYHDVLVIRELRKLTHDVQSRAKVAEPVSNEKKKWLTWGEFLDVCDRLEQETGLNPDKAQRAGRGLRNQHRTDTAIAWSLEKFLIFSILACVPDRQRTIRELEVGRTLVKQFEGDNGEYRWAIKHGPKDYKTGKDYGVRPLMFLEPKLNYYMELWLGTYRNMLAKDHNFVFCTRGGEPLNAQATHRLFVSAAERITGKKTNPHLVRDMIVTHLRGSEASEKELEALAIYMGHSVDMQRKTYDRRSKAEKVKPAVDLLAKLNNRGSAPSAASPGHD